MCLFYLFIYFFLLKFMNVVVNTIKVEISLTLMNN